MSGFYTPEGMWLEWPPGETNVTYGTYVTPTKFIPFETEEEDNAE